MSSSRHLSEEYHEHYLPPHFLDLQDHRRTPNTHNQHRKESPLPTQTDNSISSKNSEVNFIPETNLTRNFAFRTFHNKIQASIGVVQKNSIVKKGNAKQTTNLSKYVYGEIMKHLSTLYLTNQLNKDQIISLQKFKKGRGKLSTYPFLLKDKFIKQQCQSLLQSSLFVNRLLTSERMSMINKLTVLKLL